MLQDPASITTIPADIQADYDKLDEEWQDEADRLGANLGGCRIYTLLSFGPEAAAADFYTEGLPDAVQQQLDRLGRTGGTFMSKGEELDSTLPACVFCAMPKDVYATVLRYADASSRVSLARVLAMMPKQAPAAAPAGNDEPN